MIAQDHALVVAHICEQTRLLIEVEHHALIVVISDFGETHGRLGEGQQAAFHRRHRHAGNGVGVNDAIDLMFGAVDGTVNDVAGAIGLVLSRVE